MPEQSPGGPRIADSCTDRTALPISEWSEETFSVPITGATPEHSKNGRGFGCYEGDRRVPVVGFDFGSLDDAEGFLLEAVAAKRPLRPIIEAMIAEQEMRIRCETVSAVVALVIGHEKKGLAVYALAEASGLNVIQGLSQQDIADKVGVSKQDVQQLSDHFRELLRLRKTRTQRGEEAKEKMSLGNFRHTKI